MWQDPNRPLISDESDYTRSELARLKTVVAYMEQSRSWRLTRPLRALAKLTRLYQLEKYRERAHKKAITIQETPAHLCQELGIRDSDQSPNVCGIGHIYYTDLANEIVDTFLRCGILTSVIITTPTPDDPQLVSAVTRLQNERPDTEVVIMPTENIGRDMYPFIQAIQHPLAKACDVFLKIHTKKSLHLDEYKGRFWRTSLLQFLASNYASTSQIAKAIKASHEIWIACPEQWAAGNESWGQNRKHVRALLSRNSQKMSKNLVFPAGSMFWGHPDFFDQILALQLDPLEFSADYRKLDGEIPHALERFVGAATISSSKKIWLLPTD